MKSLRRLWRHRQRIPPPPLPRSRRKQKPSAAKKKPEPVKGKRDNPDYCQANAYVPKTLRRAVDKALFDVEGLDYSTLVEDLLGNGSNHAAYPNNRVSAYPASCVAPYPNHR